MINIRSKFTVHLMILILLFIVNTGIKALQPYIPEIIDPLSESWRWKHFSELEGKGVSDIVEDKNGNLWIGVDEGVLEYNGYDWKLHKININDSFDSPIIKVLITQNNHIIAVSANDIYEFNGISWKALLNNTTNFNFNFSNIIETKEGELLLAYSEGILAIDSEQHKVFYTSSLKADNLKLSGQNFEIIRFPEVLNSGQDFNSVSDVLQDNSGSIWVALTYGIRGKIIRFEKERNLAPYITDYKIYESNNLLQLGEGQKFIETKNKEIWVINSSFKVPIQIYKNDKWKSISLSEKFGGDEYVNDIVQTENGIIWVGGLGKLYTFQNGKWAIYNAPDYKIPANKLELTKSLNDKIWISGLKSKVYLLDYSSQRWITYKNLNFQCEVSSNEQWFLNANGNAISKNGNNWFLWDEEDGLIDAPVKLISSKSGQIWAAGSHKGVAATAYFRNGKWHKQIHPYLSWGIDYRAVFEANDGSIWFGGSVDAELEKGQLSGVLQLENPTEEDFKWNHYKYNDKGLTQSNAYGLGQTKDGRIWLGGSNLHFFDGQEWQRPKNERLRQFVNTIASTEDLLIVGSRYYGVYIFDGEVWKNYTTESGLSNNTIISINAISNDNIWVATESDICHFDGNHWHNNIFPEQMNMDFEGGDIQHSSDGSVWINISDRGWKRRSFSHNKFQKNDFPNFYTFRYTPDDIPPETSISLFVEEVPAVGNTMIQWNGKDFFEDTPSEELYFSYKMNDEPWSPFTKENHHTFLNLGNGNYTFSVRAMDMGANIDPSPAVVNFVVLPPVWKQGWFIMLLASMLTIIFIFGFNIISKKQKLEKLNTNLKEINKKINAKGKKINSQNHEILKQQKVILAQKKSLEESNLNLEEQNHEIQDQRDKLEEMIKQVEELSKAKISFFTNISHEFRTPLSLILGPVSQLKNPSTKLSLDERIKLYEIVERNANRLLTLINQLLEIRRIENSSLDLKLQEIDVNQFLLKISSLFQDLSDKRSISLNYNSQIENQKAWLDADKVEKIAVNLIANAFKHTEDQGSIEISLSLIDKEVEITGTIPDKPYFHIQIKDSGKGIEPDVLNHIFERYYHHEGIDKNQNSSGIGLSYIKDLVEIHEGIIHVQSEKGVGSCFCVYLPVLQSKVKTNSMDLKDIEFQYAQKEIRSALDEINEELFDLKLQQDDFDAKKPHILIVEDNTDMALFLKGLLAPKYNVITAKNGIEGMENAQRNNFDIIISDIMVPEMSGLEFCKKLKENFATSHIPVILLTAKSLEDHELEGYEMGAEDYITKPFNPQILELKIRNILNQISSFHTKLSSDLRFTPKEIKLSSPDEIMLNKLVVLMEANIDKSEFNVNSMSRSVNLSHQHFIRKVKQLTGKKPSDLLKTFRMQRSRDLLKQNKLTIAEVAYKVGFEMPSSFTRAFKKEYGITPKEYVYDTSKKQEP